MKRRQPVIVSAVGLLLALCLGVVGCVATPPSAAVERDAAAATLRETTPPGRLFGMTGEARQIERNLGVR